MKLRIFNHKFDSSKLCFICEMAHPCFVYAQKYKAINVKSIEGVWVRIRYETVAFLTSWNWIIQHSFELSSASPEFLLNIFFLSLHMKPQKPGFNEEHTCTSTTRTHTSRKSPIRIKQRIIAVQQMKKIHKQTNRLSSADPICLVSIKASSHAMPCRCNE